MRKPIAFADPCTARANGVDSVNNTDIRPLDAGSGFHPFAASCQDKSTTVSIDRWVAYASRAYCWLMATGASS